MRRFGMKRWRKSPVLNGVQEKTITLISNNSDVVLTRRAIAADAILHDLRLVSFDEKRGHMTTTFDVTVAGHPRRIREYRDARRNEHSSWGGGGDIGDLVFEFLFDLIVVPPYQALRRRWQGRNDPPLEQGRFVGLEGIRAIVNWTRVSEDASGEPLGMVTIDMYSYGKATTDGQEWPEPVRRSIAQAYAAEHDYILIVDD
jgi:hypothetical protein